MTSTPERFRIFGSSGKLYTVNLGHRAATDAFGGTTNIVLDAEANVLRRYVSLAGTVRNCAGGITPWGAWLTVCVAH